MRLLLIRHGETVDNVAGIYAGTTDSALTTHGVLQASRLGAHLADARVKISHLFSSDLQRAFRTAEAVRLAQRHLSGAAPEAVTQLHSLREQDFGFYEGKRFNERPRGSDMTGQKIHANIAGFREVESKQSMMARVEAFIDENLVSLLGQVGDEESVVVVAHGIILSHLWRGILSRFEPENISVATGVVTGDNGMGLEHLGGWSNTGYLDLEIKPKFRHESTTDVESTPTIGKSKDANGRPTSLQTARSILVTPTQTGPAHPPQTQPILILSAASGAGPVLRPNLPNMSLVVKAVNSQEHLKGLKKTRGGIGSSKHDEKQKTMDHFFKRKRLG